MNPQAETVLNDTRVNELKFAAFIPSGIRSGAGDGGLEMAFYGFPLSHATNAADRANRSIKSYISNSVDLQHPRRAPLPVHSTVLEIAARGWPLLCCS